MNFLELQNGTLSDRFGETKRDNCKQWINYRYGRVWASEPWTFKLQKTTLAITAGSPSVSLGTLGDIISIGDFNSGTYAQGMSAVRPEDYQKYVTTTRRQPKGFTVIGNTIYFDSPSDVNRSLDVISQAGFTPLVGDLDVPLIPSEFHQLLIYAAAATGLQAENDPSAEINEKLYDTGMEDMRREYLSSAVYSSAYPDWP